MSLTPSDCTYNSMTSVEQLNLLYKVDAIDMADSLNKHLNKINDTQFNDMFTNLVNNFTIQKSLEYLCQITSKSTDDFAKILALGYINELYELLYKYKFVDIMTAYV